MRKSGLNTFIKNLQRPLSRRQLIAAGAGVVSAAAFAQLLPRAWWATLGRNRRIEGEILGAPAQIGHRLRDQSRFPAPTEFKSIPCLIVGGGISGLSAAWRLQKKGMTDFALLELDREVGGNSRSGKNEVSAYPWGAHYVPIPNSGSVWVRELFEELGVIEGYDSAQRPIYNELHLCSDPQERLWIRGRWQEGLVPHRGVPESEQAEIRQFFSAMEEFRRAKGSDGKRAFEIPLEESSRDPRFTALDRISMANFLQQKGWNSPHLHWYVNYCCRDDFGTDLGQVSAWAGIHYFASRSGVAANAPAQSVLTWPQGNGWLVEKLRTQVASQIQSSMLVFDVRPSATGVEIDCFDLTRQVTVRWSAKSAIFAAPRFIAAHVVAPLRERHMTEFKDFTYAPWMVANVTLDELPEGPGAPLSWDNVSYQSDSLGYVLSTHQEISRYPTQKTVLTYYLPLSHEDPQSSRKAALKRSHESWKTQVVEDLNQMHPGIEAKISRIDVWLWGHGMIRPTPGFIWGAARKDAQKPIGKLFFAHSDLSGMSIFEEAQYWGVRAAHDALAALRGKG